METNSARVAAVYPFASALNDLSPPRPPGDPPEGKPCKICGVKREPIWALGKWRSVEVCKVCRELGEAMAAEAEKEYQAALVIAARERKIKENVPMEYRDTPLTEQKRILALLEGEPDISIITISGTNGIGKTRIAYGVVLYCIQLGQEFTFRETIGFARTLQSERMEEGYDGYFARFTEGKNILILDDLGTEKGTDFWLQELYDIINQRHIWHRPTLITTKLTEGQVAKVYGGSIYDRLKVGWIALSGKSYRRKAT